MQPSNPFCSCYSPISVLFSDLDKVRQTGMCLSMYKLYTCQAIMHACAYVGHSCIMFLNYKAMTRSGLKEVIDKRMIIMII